MLLQSQRLSHSAMTRWDPLLTQSTICCMPTLRFWMLMPATSAACRQQECAVCHSRNNHSHVKSRAWTATQYAPPWGLQRSAPAMWHCARPGFCGSVRMGKGLDRPHQLPPCSEHRDACHPATIILKQPGPAAGWPAQLCPAVVKHLLGTVRAPPQRNHDLLLPVSAGGETSFTSKRCFTRPASSARFSM